MVVLVFKLRLTFIQTMMGFLNQQLSCWLLQWKKISLKLRSNLTICPIVIMYFQSLVLIQDSDPRFPC